MGSMGGNPVDTTLRFRVKHVPNTSQTTKGLAGVTANPFCWLYLNARTRYWCHSIRPLNLVPWGRA
jgi:hypothetical protein